MKRLFTLALILLLCLGQSFAQLSVTTSTDGQTVQTTLSLAQQKGLRPKRHSVKWYETLEDIAKRYNVSQQVIIEYNNLTSTQLTRRQVLLIPTWMSGVEVEQNPEAGVASQDSLNGLLYGVDSSAIEKADKMPKKLVGSRRVEIALILPVTSNSKEGYNAQYLDLYTGALLAARDLNESEVEVVINLYDQGAYNSIDEIFLSPGFKNNQLIIGPVLASSLGVAARYAEQMEIPLVSPLDQAAEKYLQGNNYYIQAPTGNNSQIDNSLAMLQRYCYDPLMDVMLIYQKGYEGTDEVKKATAYLDSNNIVYTSLNYNLLEGREITPAMMQMMDSTRKQVVFVASNSEAFVNDVVRNMHLCHNMKRNITIVGLSKWKNFETIDVEDFHKMNLNLSLPFFVDYGNKRTKDFILRYRALFNVEPTAFSFQGYDLTLYFARQLANYGKDFIRQERLEKEALLQNVMDFYRVEGGGLENRGTKNVLYKSDFTIEEL